MEGKVRLATTVCLEHPRITVPWVPEGEGETGRGDPPVVVGVLGVIPLFNHPHKGGQLGAIKELVYGGELLHEVEAEHGQGVALSLLCKPKDVKLPVGLSILRSPKQCQLGPGHSSIRQMHRCTCSQHRTLLQQLHNAFLSPRMNARPFLEICMSTKPAATTQPARHLLTKVH